LNQACLADLTIALTKHVGPLAKLLIKNRVSATTGIQALMEQLAAEVPAKRDREKFLADAQAIVRKRR
jgi:hypothetical protein